ncbi:MAG TPA: GAF domain-containing sensor histidine kinase [Nakamurella sp.]
MDHAVRPEQIVGGYRERMDALVRAVLAVSSGLALDATLRRIVEAAVDLVDARYGALAVLGEAGVFEQFVHVGVDDPTGDRIGPAPTGQGVLGVPIEELGRLRLSDLAQHPASIGFPPHHPPMRTLLGVPILAGGEVFGRLYLAEKTDGRDFTMDDEIIMRGLAAAAGSAVDNAHLYEQGQRRERWLEATGEVTTELLAGSDTKNALQLIASRAQELTASDYTLIALPRQREGAPWEITELAVVVCLGMGDDSITGRVIPVAGSTTGAVFTDHVPRSVDRFALDLARGLGTQFGPALAMPLGTGKSLAGVLVTARQPGSPAYDEHALKLVATFADHAALALRDAENEWARRELRVLADRDRIARDMHDQVLQQLYGVGMAMQSTQQRIRAPELAARITDHMNQLQQIISGIRSAIYDLSPDPAGVAPLRTSLHTVITELTADAPLSSTVRMSGQLDRVPARIAQHAEAVLREAVSNAVRHSRAAELAVTITVGDALVIDVRDNGVGIPDTVTRSGLNNMQVRAKQVGGACTITPADGGGTRVRWTAPLR